MPSRDVRFYTHLAVSCALIGIATDWIELGIEQQGWLSQPTLIGLVLMLFALVLLVGGGKWFRLSTDDQDVTPPEGIEK